MTPATPTTPKSPWTPGWLSVLAPPNYSPTSCRILEAVRRSAHERDGGLVDGADSDQPAPGRCDGPDNGPGWRKGVPGHEGEAERVWASDPYRLETDGGQSGKADYFSGHA